jgi:hypothetical protein
MTIRKFAERCPVIHCQQISDQWLIVYVMADTSLLTRIWCREHDVRRLNEVVRIYKRLGVKFTERIPIIPSKCKLRQTHENRENWVEMTCSSYKNTGNLDHESSIIVTPISWRCSDVVSTKTVFKLFITHRNWNGSIVKVTVHICVIFCYYLFYDPNDPNDPIQSMNIRRVTGWIPMETCSILYFHLFLIFMCNIFSTCFSILTPLFF